MNQKPEGVKSLIELNKILKLKTSGEAQTQKPMTSPAANVLGLLSCLSKSGAAAAQISLSCGLVRAAQGFAGCSIFGLGQI